MYKRDSQKRKFWAAYSALKPFGKTIEGHAEMQKYVDRIVRSRYFKANHPDLDEFHIETQGRSIRYAEGVVSIPKRTQTIKDIDLLRYIAYSLKPKLEPWHCREFCRAYLNLVRRFVSSGAGDTLKREFVRLKVKHTSRRERKDLKGKIPIFGGMTDFERVLEDMINASK